MPWTATFANGKFTGTTAFSPEITAYIASVPHAALDNVTGLKVEGTTENQNVKDEKGIRQGRTIKVRVTAGGASCSAELRAKDFYNRSTD